MLEEPINPSFGELLRFYRERSVDRRVRARLSQDHFAIRLSEKTGLMVTRNRVSNWETDKTRITVDDRDFLLSILAVLYEHDGITSLDEANQLLEAGNYRSLKPAEVQQIFPPEEIDPAPRHTNTQDLDREKIVSSVLESTLLKTGRNFQRILADANVGPQPAWPRVLVVLTRTVLDHWTVFNALRVLMWIWLWVLTWWLIAPSLRWPFQNREEAITGIATYVGATILLPPLIGLLTNQTNNDFWQKQKLTTKWVLHLYTYQGAGIGFHLGYFVAFFIALVIYYLHLYTAVWFELPIALFPLILGYIGAQLIPYNLWRAYGRLHVSDGAVFFIFLILGPLWGYFFLSFYSYFLTPIVSSVMILLTATSLAALMAWQKRRTGSTLIPSYWWSLIYGLILVLHEISTGENWYNVTALAGLILVLSALLALERVNFTLVGIFAVTVGIGLLLIILKLNILTGLILASLLIFIWWGWGKRFLSFPPSFWAVILVDGACSWAMRRGLLSEVFASIAVATIALLALLWERYR